ncbi:MAG TPA: C25 family cysteine peptidase [Terriglobales bacterium]|nr:C25 family cysteine peptidase [Terriglobales bacterium]
MAVDATTSAQNELTTAANTLTFAHTTTATGTNLVLVVGVSMNISQRTATTVSGITYNGVALTRAGVQNDSSNAVRTEIWYLINPGTGTHNVVVTENIGGILSTIGTVAGATTFTGADQTTPIRAFASNQSAGTNANAYVNVASGPNDYVLDTLAATSGTTANITSPAQTQQWSLNSTGGTRDVYGFGSTRVGSASASMSETLSGNARWSDSAVSIQPSQADLQVAATGTSTLFPANISYTVTVTNNGPSTASSVSLTNTLPAGLTFVSAVATGGGTCTVANCNWTSVAAGAGNSVSVTITATPSLPGGYPLTSSVTATSADLNNANDDTTSVSYSQFTDCATTTVTAGGNLGGVINTYYPGTATATAGSTSITVGPGTGAANNIAVGDLLLVIQMQDAAINSTNTSQYGDGISGSGSTTLNNSGVYEYATATSAVTVGTGGTVNIAAAGPGGGLLYTYTSAADTTAQGARTFQVIRVPNYATATLTSTLTASAWNGSTGGVLALNVSGTLTLNGATVSVNGLGFRGAAGLFMNGAAGAANTDYRFPAPTAYNTATLTRTAGAHASKGEGIGGTPEWIENVTGTTAGVVTTGTVASTNQGVAEGYPQGSMARGAPGNAGGGGNDADPAANDQNSGGGAGANGGSGGSGGNSWNTNLAVGGNGGTAFPADISRVVMGGGGGAGTSNNNSNFMSSSGAPGGGIVMIRAATISGNATITANGLAAYNATPNDGGGGGGAGGSIIFLWGAVTGTPTVTLNANGGRGGDAWDSDNGGAQGGLNADRHGPGGGGGGGVLLYTGTGATMTTAVTGGAAGITLNTAGVTYGASAGGNGITTTGVTLASSPGPHSASGCVDLSITKSASPSPVIVNTTLTYTITVTNNNATTAATGITVTDAIPAQVTFVSVSFVGGTGGSCPAPSGGVLTCTFTSLAASSSAIITIRTTAAVQYSLAVNTAIVNATTPDPNPLNNTATVSTPIEGPTSVRLNTFIATQNGTDVLISWKSGGELHNLGFNVYKELGGEKVRLNPSLIAGSALMMRETLEQHTAKSYGWIDHGAGAGALYWLEDVDLNGTRTLHGPISVESQIAANMPPAMAQAMTISDLSQASSKGEGRVRTDSQVREFLVHPILTAANQSIGFQLAAQPAVKISIDHEGWYRITQPQLVAGGLAGSVDARLLHLYAEGVEQPIRITGTSSSFGSQSAIEFYGTAIDTPYSGDRVYWLTVGTTPGLRIAEVSPSGTIGPLEQTFVQTIELKPRTTYFAALLQENTDNFFGPLISPTSAVLNVTTSNVVPGQGMFEISLQGVTGNQQHEVSVMLNGATLGEVRFQGQQLARANFAIPAGVLANGANEITLTAELGSKDLSLVDHIDLSFPHTLTADSNLLKFTVNQGQSVTVGGFAQPPTRLIDITNPLRPLFVAFQTKKVNGQYAVSTSVSWTSLGKHTLLALSDSQLGKAASLAPHHPSTLHAIQPGAEVVMLTYPQFNPQINPLAALRRQQGKSVALLNVDEIYDEFNFGEPSPDSIKAFLLTATKAWKNKPHYLLLAGDASLDPRNYLGFGFFDFVPTKIVVTAELKTASDDWFSDFNNTGLAQIATGRLPARTSADAATMIAKTVGYNSSPVGSWTNQVMMVADSDDPSTSFAQQSLVIQKSFPTSMNVTDVFAGVVGPDVARQDVLAGIENGQLLVNYSGHGSVEIWSGNDIFDDTTASSLTNGSNLPVFVMMNCLNGFFQDVYTESLAESLMLAQNGGAVAVWASSGLTTPEPQFQMNQTLLQTLFAQPTTRLGDAVLAAKANASDLDTRRTFILFGDPLLRLK